MIRYAYYYQLQTLRRINCYSAKGPIMRALFIGLALFSIQASAALYDRGNGMIYDDVLNITWLKDANYALTSGYDSDGLMTWAEAKAWAENLSYGGFNDWRLPSIYNNGIGSAAFAELYGTNYIGEIGYMYFVNLENESQLVNSSCLVAPNGCLQNIEFNDAASSNLISFQNIQASFDYWYEDKFPFEGEVPPEEPFLADPAYSFSTFYGVESVQYAGGSSFAWAVRSGDINPIPLPAGFWLFISGLTLLFSARSSLANAL